MARRHELQEQIPKPSHRPRDRTMLRCRCMLLHKVRPDVISPHARVGIETTRFSGHNRFSRSQLQRLGGLGEAPKKFALILDLPCGVERADPCV
jgi:hypothetical protein